jgi:signal peptidase I
VQQVFSTDGTSPEPAWIRYQHFVPSWEAWQKLPDGPLSPDVVKSIRPQLITDFYAYNTSATRDQPQQLDPSRLGMHWVGDLMVECELEVSSQSGQVLLDLVEAGRHYQCEIDVASGKATLSIQGLAGFAPQAITGLRGPGQYTLALANVDDQLLLWVDGKLVPFDAPTAYLSETLGSRRPRSTADDAGDLAPAGIGTRGAALKISGLRVLRDTYYIADRHGQNIGPISDYAPGTGPTARFSSAGAVDFLSDPNQWDVFDRLGWVEFPLADDQFFVLGDNSPFSKDGRLWDQEHFGHYVERPLLIGKALFIYWPHSWNRLPGTRVPFPFFPNFADMGLVR